MTTNKQERAGLILELNRAIDALTIEEAMAIAIITAVMAKDVEPSKPAQARLFRALHDLAQHQVERQ